MVQQEILLNPSVPAEDEHRLSRQCIALLDRLRRGPLTNMDAVTELRILNLTARVSELRQAGHRVTATRVDQGLFSYALGAA
jgi:hypothetical protein